MSITTQPGPHSPSAPVIPSFALRVLALCYGGLAYLIFLGTFLYAIGFVSQYVVPKTIDSGPASALPTALLIARTISFALPVASWSTLTQP